MKLGVPCFTDGLNKEEALQVIKDKAKSLLCPLEVVVPNEDDRDVLRSSPLKGEYQLSNLAVALRIIESLRKFYTFSRDQTIAGIRNTHWPGRLETLSIPELGDILIDGAHNKDAAVELGRYLKSTYPAESITLSSV